MDEPPSGSTENYAPTYYPGVSNAAAAQSLTVDSGGEVSAVFTMPVVRFARVSGTVVDSQGRPFTGGFVQLRQAGGTIGFAQTGTPLRPGGAFTFSNLEPGDYVLTFRSDYFKERNNAVELASMPLVVDGSDITGLVLATAPGATVSGRLVFEGRSPPDLTKVAVTVVPAQGGVVRPGSPSQPPDRDGRFLLHGIAGPVLFRPFVATPGWTLKAVAVDGQDITDVPYEFRGGEQVNGLEITLTDRITSLAGTVRDDRGTTVNDYVVMMLPENLPRGAIPTRFVRTARPDRKGRFSALALPPGSYVVAALPSLGPTREWDPRVQEAIRKAGTRLSLTEGQSAMLDLTLRTLN
jgi:hypothetical protein